MKHHKPSSDLTAVSWELFCTPFCHIQAPNVRNLHKYWVINKVFMKFLLIFPFFFVLLQKIVCMWACYACMCFNQHTYFKKRHWCFVFDYSEPRKFRIAVRNNVRSDAYGYDITSPECAEGASPCCTLFRVFIIRRRCLFCSFTAMPIRGARIKDELTWAPTFFCVYDETLT